MTYAYLAGMILSVIGATVIVTATPRQPVRRPLVALFAAAALWCLADLLANLATSAAQMRTLAYLFVPAWALVPYLLVRVTLAYAGRPWLLWREALLAAPAAVIVVLMWRGALFVDFTPAGVRAPYFHSHASPWLFLVAVYFSAAVVVGTVVLLAAARRSGTAAFVRASRYLVVVVLPICLVAFPTNGGLSLLGVVTPYIGSLAMAAGSAALLVGMLRFGLLAPPGIAERRAVESEDRYRALVEASPDSIAVIGLDGRMLMANQRAAELLGYPSPEALVAALPVPAEALADADRPRLVEVLERMRREGLVRDVEWVVQRRDGESVPVEASAALLRDAEGAPAGFVVVGRDIRARKRAAVEQAQLQAQLQHGQKLESMGVLAGGIAHDFNNLLVGILGHAALARQELPPTAPLYERLSRIETAATRAAELTRQMLDYSGRGKMVVESVSLPQLTREIAALIEASISKRIELVFELPPDLPRLLADAGQLQQVVLNLLTNAAEAIGEGDGRITVTAREVGVVAGQLFDHRSGAPLAAGDYLSLEVADTGPGMSAEVQAKIWDPFFTTKFAGRGLGLAAVAGIVQAHDGAVVVDSAVGLGTRMQVLLPVGEGQVVAHQRRLTPIPPQQASWRGQGTVLVVDDEELVREVARLSLEQVGYTVVTAEDGQRGVELLSEHRDQVVSVVLDLTMPRMDGPEAFARMRALVPDLPVIVISGYSRDDANARLGELAVTAGFLQKPFNPAELIGLLHAVEESRPPSRA